MIIHRIGMKSWPGITGLACVALLGLVSGALGTERWFRGNTHTHTWWSDGDSPPEFAARWYKEHGYHFLVLTDHNILNQGEKWVEATGRRAGAVERYERQFVDSLVKREIDGKTRYRLKTLDELREMYEQPGQFILIQGEEITDSVGGKPVHLNALNVREYIPPQGGDTVKECIQRNIDAVVAQREATGQPMLVHVDHPNFGWAVTPADLVPVRGDRFVEIYNGHRGVHNHGDETRMSVERMWDMVLARGLGELDLPLMYGLASDDAHNFVTFPDTSNPGRGWIMVRAKELTPDALIKAMQKGDFYASTGVTLKNITFADNTLAVEIDARPGVTYRTQFIGTPRDYDRKVTTRPAADSTTAYVYSDDIGQVLAEETGSRVSYSCTGNELYVRARIISDNKHPNPFAEGDLEVAWTQPFEPSR